MKSCLAPHCANPVQARGLCNGHYSHWHRHGNMDFHITKTDAQRFWGRVEKSDLCWNWTATIAGKYGQFHALGRKRPAHRYSWELHFGSIPDGLFVCHRCDNPLCVRPDHLFLGDASANMQDMVKKGRHPKTLSSYRSKLTSQQVSLIRESKETTAQLARQYGVDPTTIRWARSGRSWKNLRRSNDGSSQSHRGNL